MVLVNEDTGAAFPPDNWFTHRINRKTIQTLRAVYRAHNIDPAFIRNYERQLGSGTSATGNLLSWIIAAMGDSALARLARDITEDASTLQEGNPMARWNFDDQGRPISSGPPAAIPPAQPSVAIVETARQETARLSTYRNLTPTLEGGEHEQRTAGSRPEANSHASETKPELSANAGREDRSNGLHLPRQGPEAPAAVHSAPGEQFRTYRNPLHAESQPLTLITTNLSRPGPSKPMPETSSPFASAQQLPADEAALFTPKRRPLARTASSPHLETMFEKSKRKDSQRKNLLDLEMTFSLHDYLLTFKERATKHLKRADLLEEDEKADVVLTMLQSDVKKRLTGSKFLVNPSSPEEIFEGLETAFPSNTQQLSLDISSISQDTQESAVEYLERAQTLHVQNQVPLPETADDCARIWMNGKKNFISFCQEALRMRIFNAKMNTTKLVFNWGDFQALARDFDSSTTLMAKVSNKHRTPALAAEHKDSQHDSYPACEDQPHRDTIVL